MMVPPHYPIYSRTLLSLSWQQRLNQEENTFLSTEHRKESIGLWTRPQTSREINEVKKKQQAEGVCVVLGGGIFLPETFSPCEQGGGGKGPYLVDKPSTVITLESFKHTVLFFL